MSLPLRFLRVRRGDESDVVPIGLALLSSEGRVRWANADSGRLVSRSREECLDQPFNDLVGLTTEGESLRTGSAVLAVGDGKVIVPLEMTGGSLAEGEGGLVWPRPGHHAAAGRRGNIRVPSRCTVRHSNRRRMVSWSSTVRGTSSPTIATFCCSGSERLTTTGRDADLLQFVLEKPVAMAMRSSIGWNSSTPAPEESGYDEDLRLHRRPGVRALFQPQHIDGAWPSAAVWSFRDVIR